LRGRSAPPRYAHPAEETAPEERITIAVPALVEAALFDAVAERLDRNRKHHGRPWRQGRYLLQGLVVCVRCGYAYYGKSCGRRAGEPEDSRPMYYRCLGRDPRRPGGEPDCHSAMVRVDRLDAVVWGEVRRLLSDPGRIAGEYERRLEADAGDGGVPAVTAKLIGGMRRRISRLLELYEEGYIDKGDFTRKIESAKIRLSGLEAEAEASRGREEQRAGLRLLIGQLEEFAAQVREGLETCDHHVRREIIRALVKRVEIDEQGVRIVYHVSPGPFAESPGMGVVQYRRDSYTRRP
jgi:site-specific DNA recombinase